ncbi:MAG: type II toxin-antitoxin system ChpB family toxin [Acidobacteria bacterium]|nr:type II toxin-antitoxin system ChpB family toxin [Acidobacteriota bacterium]
MNRGDTYHVDLNPTQGREQAGARFVLIVSPAEFNVMGTPLVCPISQGGNFARHAGFAVSLSGTGTQTSGVVLCNQARVLDLHARRARFIEKVPKFLVDEVLARLSTLID